MRLLHLSAEAAPLAGFGDLPEAAGGLALAQAAAGHDVRVVLPYGALVDRKRWAPVLVARFGVPHVGGDQAARIYEARHAGVRFYLVAGPPILRSWRPNRAAAAKDAPALIFTALAALGVCRALAWQPDVLHGHGALAGPALYWLDSDGARDSFFEHTAGVLTLYTPGAPPAIARALLDYGLAPSDSPVLPEWARASLLGLGVAHATRLSTFGANAAEAVFTAGGGLEGALQARRERLSASPPGLDLAAWDPARDRHLAARYDESRLERRAVNKRALQKALGLPTEAAAPLLALPASLIGDDALALAEPSLRALLGAMPAAQVVVLGARVPALAGACGERVRARPALEPALFRQVLAGADLLLLLGQGTPAAFAALAALRYGAVPVVAAAGAHAEVVVDQAQTRRGTGFCFSDYNAGALQAVLQRALRLYRQPQRWQALQRRGMRQARAWAWTRSAAAHLALYQQALTLRKEAATRLAQRLADGAAADDAAPAGHAFDGPGAATLL